MKKFLSVLLVAIITVTSLSVQAFAVNLRQYTVYDEYGNEFRINENEVLVVVYDEDGNVISNDRQGRMTYVDGTQYTIPGKGSVVTYQYSPSSYFFAGFCFTHPSYSPYATTRNRNVSVTIRNSSTIGGTRYNVKSKSFSTNEEDNWGDANYNDINPGKTYVGIIAESISSSRGYYDAKYINESTNPLTIALYISMD